MKQERVIAILDFYRDIDKTVTMNERVIRNLEDQYYSTLGAVNSDGMPHGKGGVSNPVERVVLNIPQSVSETIANMRRENEKLTAIKGEILSELNALNYREKAVIYGFYIIHSNRLLSHRDIRFYPFLKVCRRHFLKLRHAPLI